MIRMDFNKIIEGTRTFTAEHSPQIFAGLGVVGVVGTAYSAVRGTVTLIESWENENACNLAELRERRDTFNKTEVAKSALKHYYPMLVSGTLTIVSITLGTKISSDRLTALAGAYAISERALGDYKTKMVEVVGKEKAEEVRDRIDQDLLRTNPMNGQMIFATGRGTDLCFDTYSGRYFLSSVEAMRMAQNDLNDELFHGVWVSLNRLYDFLGLDHVQLGEDLGWNTDDLVSLSFGTQMTPDNKPCIVLRYNTEPSLDMYRR